jgi:peptidoglycan LD-endopeptidase LytH
VTSLTEVFGGMWLIREQGTAVRSATQGYVVRMGHNALGGKVVLIAGAGGRRYYYAHLEAFAAEMAGVVSLQAGRS